MLCYYFFCNVHFVRLCEKSIKLLMEMRPSVCFEKCRELECRYSNFFFPFPTQLSDAIFILLLPCVCFIVPSPLASDCRSLRPEAVLRIKILLLCLNLIRHE